MIFWLPVFFFTSLLYASVGLGGASAYLAYLSIMDIPYEYIPSTALLLGLLSAGVVTLNWWRHLKRGVILPFLAVSMPSAYLGGALWVSEDVFKWLLAVVLLVVAFCMLFFGSVEYKVRQANLWVVGIAVGIPLGFLAGVVGIGGGVFLVPILSYGRLCPFKAATASGAAFIFFNSLTGIMGHMSKGTLDPSSFLLLIPVALGSFIGSFVSSRHLKPEIVRKTFGLAILGIAILEALTAKD